MEFRCQNQECENYAKPILEGNCHYRMVGDKLLADERFCKACKKEMIEMKEEGAWKHVLVGEYFGSPNKNWNKPVGEGKTTLY